MATSPDPKRASLRPTRPFSDGSIMRDQIISNTSIALHMLGYTTGRQEFDIITIPCEGTNLSEGGLETARLIAAVVIFQGKYFRPVLQSRAALGLGDALEKLFVASMEMLDAAQGREPGKDEYTLEWLLPASKDVMATKFGLFLRGWRSLFRGKGRW